MGDVGCELLGVWGETLDDRSCQLLSLEQEGGGGGQLGGGWVRWALVEVVVWWTRGADGTRVRSGVDDG